MSYEAKISFLSSMNTISVFCLIYYNLMSNSLEMMFNFGTRRTFRNLRLEFSFTSSILLYSLKREETYNHVRKNEFEKCPDKSKYLLCKSGKNVADVV